MIEIIFSMIVVLLSAIIIVLIRSKYRIQKLADNRLQFIRDWFDLMYVYSNDPQSFYNRSRIHSHVKQLAKYNIVDWSPPNAELRMKWHKMSVSEKQFLCLMHAGFSNRELCAIFQVTKISSIYVKYYRIKSK